MLTGQSDVCLRAHLLLTLCCVVFSLWIIQPLLSSAMTHVSVLVIETCLKPILSQNAVLDHKTSSQSPKTPQWVNNPVTGLVSPCVSHRHVCISYLSQVSLTCCVCSRKCFPNKGIIIPTYFCVLQSWHPESRHGDKTWTTGPRETCSLFCHRHLFICPLSL